MTIISINGIDGCGKGTQIWFLKKALEKMGYAIFISKAYDQAEKEIFSLFIEYSDQKTIMFLFQALHTQQRKEAEMAIEREEIVIADRWDESYKVYHSNYGILKEDKALRTRLNEIAFNGTIPDMNFLLDVSVEKAQERCNIRGADFFDKMPIEYHETMKKGYLELVKERKGFIINGDKTINEVHKEIISKVLDKLE